MSPRERFVARRVGRLTDELCRLDGWGPGGGPEAFRVFARLVAALFHFELHDCEQHLSDLWHAAGRDQAAGAAVTGELSTMLARANYTPVTVAELDDALTRESLIPLRLQVDLDDYDEVLIARRGSHHQTVTVPRWKGLRSVEHTMTVDEEVVVATRVRPAKWFATRGRDPGERSLEPGRLSLKQFQNVPRADIEMLLPSTQVRFRPVDTLMVGVPAVASGIAVLVTKLAPTIGLMVLLVGAWLGLRDEAPQLDQTALVVLVGGLVTVGGFVFRQWNKLKNRRLRYLKTLSENLYFRTVGDGPGVIHTLLAAAEQQEVMEVLLAYRFLLAADEAAGLDPGELDRRIETWLAGDGLGRDVDFEVDDALAKLERLELIERAANEAQWAAVPVPYALERLDRRWDDLFRHARPGPG